MIVRLGNCFTTVYFIFYLFMNNPMARLVLPALSALLEFVCSLLKIVHVVFKPEPLITFSRVKLKRMLYIIVCLKFPGCFLVFYSMCTVPFLSAYRIISRFKVDEYIMDSNIIVNSFLVDLL